MFDTRVLTKYVFKSMYKGIFTNKFIENEHDSGLECLMNQFILTVGTQNTNFIFLKRKFDLIPGF